MPPTMLVGDYRPHGNASRRRLVPPEKRAEIYRIQQQIDALMEDINVIMDGCGICWDARSRQRQRIKREGGK